MLYDRSDVSGTDVNQTNASKNVVFCPNWYFLEIWFWFQSFVCNGCHNVLAMSFGISNITILNIYVVYYDCFIPEISRLRNTSNNLKIEI